MDYHACDLGYVVHVHAGHRSLYMHNVTIRPSSQFLYAFEYMHACFPITTCTFMCFAAVPTCVRMHYIATPVSHCNPFCVRRITLQLLYAFVCMLLQFLHASVCFWLKFLHAFKYIAFVQLKTLRFVKSCQNVSKRVKNLCVSKKSYPKGW